VVKHGRRGVPVVPQRVAQAIGVGDNRDERRARVARRSHNCPHDQGIVAHAGGRIADHVVARGPVKERKIAVVVVDQRLDIAGQRQAVRRSWGPRPIIIAIFDAAVLARPLAHVARAARAGDDQERILAAAHRQLKVALGRTLSDGEIEKRGVDHSWLRRPQHAGAQQVLLSVSARSAASASIARTQRMSSASSPSLQLAGVYTRMASWRLRWRRSFNLSNGQNVW